MGFEGPENSSLPQEDLTIDDSDFRSGCVLAGQNSAINGLELDHPAST